MLEISLSLSETRLPSVTIVTKVGLRIVAFSLTLQLQTSFFTYNAQCMNFMHPQKYCKKLLFELSCDSVETYFSLSSIFLTIVEQFTVSAPTPSVS